MTRAPKRNCSPASNSWSNNSPSAAAAAAAGERVPRRRPLAGRPLAERPLAEQPLISRLLNRSEKIALADFDAALAQQCVDHADMEVEIRQHEVVQVCDTGEFPRAARELEFDAAAFGVFELGRGDRLEKIQSLGNSRLQIGKRHFG